MRFVNKKTIIKNGIEIVDADINAKNGTIVTEYFVHIILEKTSINYRLNLMHLFLMILPM